MLTQQNCLEKEILFQRRKKAADVEQKKNTKELFIHKKPNTRHNGKLHGLPL
ncbi:MAG: hypothetical protein ACJAV1_003775 [Paraglaciecola sp.]